MPQYRVPHCETIEQDTTAADAFLDAALYRFAGLTDSELATPKRRHVRLAEPIDRAVARIAECHGITFSAALTRSCVDGLLARFAALPWDGNLESRRAQ